MTQEETTSVFNVARVVSLKIMKAYHPDFVCLYARGRRIPHTHIFLVPSFQGDLMDRFFNALEVFQESPQALAQLRTQESLEEAALLLNQS